MPLIHSKSQAALKQNMRTLNADIGKSPHVQSRKQAIAIALETQRRGKAIGGLAAVKIPKPPSPNFYQRDNIRTMVKRGASPILGKGKNLFASGGLATPVDSAVPGRTDKHPVDVPPGSYVVPADVISHLGENNTAAGFAKLNKMVKGGSFGGRRRMRSRGFATGGAVEPVPIIVAGGEAILHPDAVRDIGNGKMEKGHDRLDGWVMETRKNHINTLKKLAPPQR